MSFDSYGGAVEPPESDGESRRPGGAPSLAAGVEELVVDGIDVVLATLEACVASATTGQVTWARELFA